jgi:ABC-2 type transport system permease protein
MIKNILLLARHDIATSLKNKTLYLVLFIPLFVFVSFSLIDNKNTEAVKISLGLIAQHPYQAAIVRSIEKNKEAIAVVWVQNEADGLQLLKEHKVDGMLAGSSKDSTKLTLFVLQKESIKSLTIEQTFSALQKAAEGNPENWIADIQALHEGGIQKQTLPTWILMLVLLVGFIILPAQVAEEKEKKLLLAFLQTPIQEYQWLIAKLLMGVTLILVSVLLLHLLGQFFPAHLFDYIAFVILGSFCFCSVGVLLGLLCSNQASARTLGVIFYLPQLLPSALADVSQKLTDLAPFLPSYQLFKPLQIILQEDGRIANMPIQAIYLIVLGSLALYFSNVLMKKRWLM